MSKDFRLKEFISASDYRELTPKEVTEMLRISPGVLSQWTTKGCEGVLLPSIDKNKENRKSNGKRFIRYKLEDVINFSLICDALSASIVGDVRSLEGYRKKLDALLEGKTIFQEKEDSVTRERKPMKQDLLDGLSQEKTVEKMRNELLLEGYRKVRDEAVKGLDKLLMGRVLKIEQRTKAHNIVLKINQIDKTITNLEKEARKYV